MILKKKLILAYLNLNLRMSPIAMSCALYCFIYIKIFCLPFALRNMSRIVLHLLKLCLFLHCLNANVLSSLAFID